MTETMSHLPENLITPHLTGASWNPAMRPEDAPDASVAAESTSRPAMERPSQTDEISAENTAKEDIVSKPVTQSTDEPNVATVSSGGHNEFPPSTSGPTEEGKPSNINWGEETDASWDFQSQNPFERVDVAARTNSFPAVESATEPADEEIITEQQPNAPQSYDESRTSQHEDLHLSSQLDASQNDNNNFWEADAAEDDEGEFFDQLKTQTKPIYVPPEAESRFEEGIPLVEIEVDSQPGDANKDEPQLDDVFGEDDADDFFASTATKDASAAERPTVIRKSTYDVLGALDSGVPDSPVGDSPAAFELKTEDDDLAARWQAELDDVEGSPDVPEPKAEEEDLAARWQAELDDDDDGLLLEDNVLDETKGQPQEEPTFLNGDAAGDLWSQRAPQLPSNYTNPYAPHQPSSSELVQGLPNLYAPTSGVPQTQPESDTSAPHSFVDQAKDGYKSPYDLPESLAPRPRRAVAARKTAPPSSTGMPPPPARSSSIPSSTSTPAVSSIFPQSEAQNDAPQQAIGAAPVAKNFFEELPAPAPRQRPGSRTGMYNPPASAVSSAPVPSESMLPPAVPPPFLPPSQVGPEVAYQNQLQAPERIGPYANLTVPTASTGPGIGPRYSPKPPSTSSKSPFSSRYSPAPPSSQPPSTVRNRYVSQPNNLPFQPRTSSPLAHHEKIAYEAQQPQQRPSTSSGPASLSYPISSNHTRGSFSVPTTELAGDAASQLPPHSQAPVHPFNLPANSYAPSVTSEPPRRPSTESPYLPNAGIAQPSVLPPPTNDRGFAPPRRSQTQSPGRQSFRPHFVRNPTEPVHRPASVHEPSSPTKAVHAYAIPQVTSSVRNVPELDFILPTDGRELDPLQRWKGAPVFKFAFGGLVSSCFPQHIPRYTAGQMNPMIQPAPGEAKVRQFKQILPSDGDIVRYPGPLRTKSKKKDVVAWLSSRIAALENEGVPPSLSREPDAFKRHDERILLWKLLRILVENDGTLEGTSEIEKSIRNVISPELGLTDQDNVYDSGAPSGLYPPTDGSISPEPVASKVLGQVKTELLGGNREKAVWLAVDNRLWGHAMVISSTLDKALWKQVVQEFVRREVRSAGENIESLAALYAIISGNTEESIDELVPPSARLGLQMISKEGQGINKNAVDGLERWRETLGLIINNRSPDDHQALVSLGQLLASYGRTEASHICYMFAKAFSQRSIFGGADDPQAAIVLLGSDHLKFPTTFFRDEDAIALTEVFEFATSVLAGNTAAVLPYLQPYKLQHAYILADKGLKSEAMQYCEAISSVLKASTKPSPYYHQRLFAEIDELATRLKQAPSDGASSWMSKPSMEKVSGSMWAKFSSFVAGDESEAATNGSAMDADVGPFAKVTEAATISRPPSVSEVYGSYPMAQTASNAFSRYAPANQFAPSSSPEQHRARSSMESQRSPPIGVPYSARRGSQEPATPVESNPYNFGSSNTYGSPTSFPYHSTPPQSSYVPLAPVEEDLATQAQQSYTAAPQQSALTSGLQASPERFGQPLHEVQETQAPAEMPHYGGYDPPVMSSYEPPSYQPDLGLSTDGPGQEEEPDEPEEKPKKKSFMDDEDEDDLAARAASIQKAEKARRDREADEAVRRAAEADAQRPGPAKKGWFGGWWGGKKEGESSGGPIRAKLGEENSFYYDTELKKWVNKKDPNSATASARATPPPPKGPGLQSRSVSVGSTSSAGRPPTLQRPQSVSLLGTTPDSRPSTGTGASPLATSPAFGPPNGLPPRSVSTTAATVSTPPLPPGAGGGPPPPRPSTTSLSNASSIDDLLGAPTARKGGTVKSKKKGRGYIDVMAK